MGGCRKSLNGIDTMLTATVAEFLISVAPRFDIGGSPRLSRCQLPSFR
jgi:hypothetical protein